MVVVPRGSAHGKAILIGEHAVVHGVPAIAMPVGMRMLVELGETPATGLPSAYCEWFAGVAERYTGRRWLPSRIHSELITGAGLGSSAALNVAALRALAQVAPAVTANLVTLADAGEALFHGNPSGTDVRAVLADVPIRVERTAAGVISEPVAITAEWQFELWVTPVEHDTRTMVERVSAALDAADKRAALAAAAADVAAAAAALASGDAAALGAAMNRFHSWLAQYGASTPRLEALVAQARSAGALGAKLSGAGGGGALLILWPDGAARATPPDVTAARFRLTAAGAMRVA